jgi:hypothetical protein
VNILTWNGNNINDTTNYTSRIMSEAYGLPRVAPQMGVRQGNWPLVGSVVRPKKQVVINILIENTPVATYQDQLFQWFDPDDEDPKVLVVEDDAGGNDRYIEAICDSLTMVNEAGLEWIATLSVHGDVMWREDTASTDTWNITGTGQTKSISNTGKMDAYPILTIKPTSAKTGTFDGYSKKRFITVLWSPSLAFNSYPTDIVDNAFDSATEVSGGDMQADGDDLRVYVDGVEVDRWLDDINTNNTSVWVNLDWSADITLNLRGNTSAAATTIYVYLNQNIENMPSKGIIQIGTELITYTSKNDTDKTFTGCTRGAKGTTAATHTHADSIYWVQHDIWLLYGNSSLSAPGADDDYKPMFELASSLNTSWDYDSFGEDDGVRTASWIYSLTSPIDSYGGNRGANADPWVELGMDANGRRPSSGHWGRAYIYNPAGITNANFQNGEKRIEDDTDEWGTGEIQSSADGSTWVTEYTIPTPSSADTWEAWSQNQALTAGSKYVGVFIENMDDDAEVECSDITLTITDPFTHTIGGEVSNYQISATITNETTGDAFEIDFPLLVNEQLEINTDTKTLLYKTENSRQFQALSLVGGARKHWLRLPTGTSSIRYDETGMAGVTLDFEWEERFYQ